MKKYKALFPVIFQEYPWIGSLVKAAKKVNAYGKNWIRNFIG